MSGTASKKTSKMDCQQSGGAANIDKTNDGLVVFSTNDADERIEVKKFRLLPESDVYAGNKMKYAGVIIYRHHDHDIKPGSIVILDTNSKKVTDCQKSGGDGIVHGAVYKCAFRERLNDRVVGEGFSIMKGKLEVKSTTFNLDYDGKRPYHDDTRNMNEISEKCLRKVVASWQTAGETTKKLGRTDFDVKDLLK